MDRSKAIDKIRKCLALSRSANEHEAGAALRQAQALMREHGIDEGDLQLADVAEHGAVSPCMASNVWEVRLGQMVADAFGCITFSAIHYVLAGYSKRKRRERMFVGVGGAAEVATYAYEVLARQCAAARLRHIAQQKRCKPITKTARGDLFAQGWVVGASQLVERLAGRPAHRALIHQYMDRHHPQLRDVDARNTAVGRNVRDDAVQGLRAGQQARLDRGLGQAAGPAQLQHAEGAR